MSELDSIPELDPDAWYEECPDCPPDGFCTTCWDEGVIVHGCLVEVSA